MCLLGTAGYKPPVHQSARHRGHRLQADLAARPCRATFQPHRNPSVSKLIGGGVNERIRVTRLMGMYPPKEMAERTAAPSRMLIEQLHPKPSLLDERNRWPADNDLREAH